MSLLSVYRNLLKKAKVFPSKNRTRILNEIRMEFRRNQNLTDPKKLAECIELATKGIQQLSMYSDLPRNSTSWAVTMEQNPMPKPNK